MKRSLCFYNRPSDIVQNHNMRPFGLEGFRRDHEHAPAQLRYRDLPRLRRGLFERTGSVGDFEAWRESLAPGDRADATEVARQRAKMHNDPITGARLLLALGDDAVAEVLLLARHATLHGGDYDRLVPLAQALEKKGRLLGTIVCYRALLAAILTRAYARAYGHAAEYLRTLRRLDARVDNYGSLTPHQAFESSIRSTHGRKVSFRNRIGA
jgi:hypothetical protein